MLKVFLKHLVYEKCIDVIFNRIQANFKTATIHRLPRKGEYLAKISHKYADEHYYNCVIKNIENHQVDMTGSIYQVIEFSYEYCSGKVFEDEEWATDQLNDYWELSGGDGKCPGEGELSIEHDLYCYFR